MQAHHASNNVEQRKRDTPSYMYQVTAKLMVFRPRVLVQLLYKPEHVGTFFVALLICKITAFVTCSGIL